VFRRWRIAGLTAATIVLGTIALASASTSSVRTFYLNAQVGQCAIFRTSTPKVLVVVPCSNGRHNLEVYAVAHGGWGQNAVPANAYSRVRSICLSAYRHVQGHALHLPYGWQGFWPDPGSEQTHYADKVLCGLTLYPGLRPLGRGRHVR
jgi:hypothetical protein